MTHKDGAHSHGSGGLGEGAIIGLGMIVCAAFAAPILTALNNLLITVAVIVAVLVVLGSVGLVLVLRFQGRGRQNSPRLVYRATPVTQRGAESLPAPRRPAIEAPREIHLHFHNATAEDVAAAIAAADARRTQ